MLDTNTFHPPLSTIHIAPQDYRNAMANLAAAVNVVTTDGVAGKAGFTATAVCSVTDSPATLLVCIQHTSSAYLTVIHNGVLCVNTLKSDQAPIANRFGGKIAMPERFAGITWQTLQTGSPVLPQSLIAFDCAIENHYDVSTHTVLICKVLALRNTESSQTESALIYAKRNYHSIA